MDVESFNLASTAPLPIEKDQSKELVAQMERLMVVKLQKKELEEQIEQLKEVKLANKKRELSYPRRSYR